MSTHAGQSVAVLAASDIPWLGRWRTLPGHEACEAGGQVWVRGPAGGDWARLPALTRFTVDSLGRLTPVGRTLPTARLPEGPWQPLAEFLRVRPPASALPALHVAPVAWTLVPASQFRPPSLMVLPFEDLARWGLTAPAVRLQPLRFALADDGRACVIGSLLPPLPGAPWCVEGRIATPAGWSLPKGVTPALVASSMRLGATETALLHEDGSAERLPAEAFVELTRGALRATAAGSAQPSSAEN
ncbi:hypothetical protein [Prosthecobacter sp.]|uniref:hypothetical protein n=1 Tax=Prosthecobacter sp. TaxID=1965333 RepID=UPI0037834CC9